MKSAMGILKFLTLWAVFGFGQRLLFWTALQGSEIEGLGEHLLPLVLTGLRFDMLVAGYVCAILFIFSRFMSGKKVVWIERGCLLVCTVVALLDLFSFVLMRDRLNAEVLAMPLDHWILFLRLNIQGMDFILALGILGLGLTLSRNFVKERPFLQKGWGNGILTIVVAAFCARGSLGPYHLDLRHSLVTPNRELNFSTLNPIYCLDQALRGRR